MKNVLLLLISLAALTPAPPAICSTHTQTLDTQLRPWVQETKLGSAILQRYVHTYSDAGDLEVLDDQGDGADDATLGYDHLHRLTSASGLWGNYGYTYDPLHNLRTRTGPGALTYSYNSFNQLSGISGSQTRTYGYNAKGYITGDGSKTFVVNPDGQITSITGVASYAYDGNGRRIRVTPQSGSIEYALYRRAGDLAFTEKGSEQTDFLKLAGQTLVELKKTGSTTSASYLHPDLLGSPRKATNSSAAILWTEHYDPWGRKLNGVAEKIGYTGHAHDPESGYAYMQARFYDPLVGRFLSTDPIHFQDDNPFTFNRYAYANNNPYRYKDPSGEIVETIWDVANVAMGVASFSGNVAAGNVAGAIVDAVGIVADTAAALTPGAPGGAGAAIKAMRVSDNAASAVTNAVKKETGSYTNTHASGKTYDGKGDRARSQESGQRVQKETGDQHTATEWTSADNSRGGFKQESSRLDSHGGPKGADNYNKIESPGKRMRVEDGEL